MKCLICGRGMHTGTNLFRVNPTGRPGVWACARHLKHTDGPPPDEATLDLIRILSKPEKKHERR